jgi:hypothetical protein
MKSALLLALLLVFAVTGAAFCQTPVAPIDLKADSIVYAYPTPGLIEIGAYFTVQAAPGPASYISELEIILGGNSVYSAPMSVIVPVDDCSDDPECDNQCQIEVSPGELKWDHCNWWSTWMGAGCDPANPEGTCDPLYLCACGSQYMVTTTVPYDGETSITFVVDPGSVVYEGDETNNSCTQMCAPPPEPVSPIDFSADSITYTFPVAGQIELRAFYTIHAAHNAASNYTSDIKVRLGSSVIYSSGMSVAVPANDCSEDIDCNNLCEITVEPGNIVYDYCNWWHTWGGPVCNPSDPAGTCEPVTYCACGSQYVLVTTVPYEAEPTATLELDGSSAVYEADETNNVHCVMIAPISTTPTTWGTIKSLFGF